MSCAVPLTDQGLKCDTVAVQKQMNLERFAAICMSYVVQWNNSSICPSLES